MTTSQLVNVIADYAKMAPALSAASLAVFLYTGKQTLDQGRSPGVPYGEISELLEETPAATAGILKPLIANGDQSLCSQVEDTAEPRVKLIKLTHRGERIYMEVKARLGI